MYMKFCTSVLLAIPFFVFGAINEVDVIVFKLTPEQLTGQVKSTWQSYFESFQIEIDTVYDICDLLPHVLKTVSPLHGLSLVACVQDPQDQLASDMTTASLYFDTQYFNRTVLSTSCLSRLAQDLQKLLQPKQTDRKFVIVGVKNEVKKLWGYNIKTQMNSISKSSELQTPIKDPILRAIFDTRNDIMKRWFQDATFDKPLSIQLRRLDIHWFTRENEAYFDVHFDVGDMKDADQVNFETQLAGIPNGVGSKQPFPSNVNYIKWMHEWVKLQRTSYSHGPMNLISYACVRFERTNVTVFHIEGSVLIDNNPRMLGYEIAYAITRGQLEKILISKEVDAISPISIQMSDFGWLAFPFAVEEVYYDLRDQSKVSEQSSVSEITKKMQNSMSVAIEGFSVGTSITPKIEQCLLTRPPIHRFEQFIKIQVLRDKNRLEWQTAPAENSEEYLDLKRDVTEYLLNLINASSLRNLVIAMQVGKLVRNIKASWFYNDIHVHLRIMYDAIAVAQRIAQSGEITNLKEQSNELLENEFTLALDMLPKTGVHLMTIDNQHFTETEEPVVCGYVYYHPTEITRQSGNFLTGVPPQPPISWLLPTGTSVVKPPITTISTPTTSVISVGGDAIEQTAPEITADDSSTWATSQPSFYLIVLPTLIISHFFCFG